jgi:hypothetical protein
LRLLCCARTTAPKMPPATGRGGEPRILLLETGACCPPAPRPQQFPLQNEGLSPPQAQAQSLARGPRLPMPVRTPTRRSSSATYRPSQDKTLILASTAAPCICGRRILPCPPKLSLRSPRPPQHIMYTICHSYARCSPRMPQAPPPPFNPLPASLLHFGHRSHPHLLHPLPPIWLSPWPNQTSCRGQPGAALRPLLLRLPLPFPNLPMCSAQTIPHLPLLLPAILHPSPTRIQTMVPRIFTISKCNRCSSSTRCRTRPNCR